MNDVSEQRPSRPLLLFWALFAAVSGAWLAWWWHDLPTLLHMDSLGYYKSAVNLARHGVFSEASAPNLHPISFRTPGYPALLAVFFKFFGAGVYIPAFLNLAMLGLTGVGVARLARCLGASERIAWCAACVMALHPMSLYWAVQVYTDTMFVALLVWALVGLAEGAAAPERRGWIIAGMTSAALLPLVRPLGLYLLPFFAIAMLMARLGVKRSVALLALLILPTGAWMARNKAQFGEFYFCEIGAWNLRYAHMNAVLAEEEGLNYGEMWATTFKETYPAIYRPETSPGTLAKRWQTEAFEIAGKHPAATVRIALRNLGPLFAPGVRDWGVHKGMPYEGVRKPSLAALIGVFEIALLLIAGGLAVRALIATRGNNRRRVVFVWLMCGALIALSLPAGYITAPRFRMPIWPLIVVLGAAGITARAGVEGSEQD